MVVRQVSSVGAKTKDETRLVGKKRGGVHCENCLSEKENIPGILVIFRRNNEELGARLGIQNKPGQTPRTNSYEDPQGMQNCIG